MDIDRAVEARRGMAGIATSEPAEAWLKSEPALEVELTLRRCMKKINQADLSKITSN